jgi:hypothetical protein
LSHGRHRGTPQRAHAQTHQPTPCSPRPHHPCSFSIPLQGHPISSYIPPRRRKRHCKPLQCRSVECSLPVRS